MTIIGIDPGLSGGIAVIENGRIVETHRIPVVKFGGKKVMDSRGLREILIERDYASRVVIEKVHAMPGQGVTSMFTFGFGAGVIEGVLAGITMPFEYVTPQKWQSILNGIDSTLKKKRSTVYCNGRFPTIGKLTDGEADAVCMALWAGGV
jgi:crossover junction endodeoxyribonuclease RuvC